MKADPHDQRRLVDIAELDLRLGGLAHRRTALPEQAALDGLEAERRAAVESAARARIHVEDLDRAIAKLRSDLDAVRRRRSSTSSARSPAARSPSRPSSPS
jgi:predicted  nucleic acid-binding Zn-ribbon protein